MKYENRFFIEKKTRNYLSWRNKKKTIRKEIENYLLHAAVESYEYVTLKMDPHNELLLLSLKLLISAQRSPKHVTN